MDNLEYAKQANKAPIKYTGHDVSLDQFVNALSGVIRSINILDECRKGMFGENGYRSAQVKGFHNNCDYLPSQYGDNVEGARVMSAILGLACKSGELLKLMQQTLKMKDCIAANSMYLSLIHI